MKFSRHRLGQRDEVMGKSNLLLPWLQMWNKSVNLWWINLTKAGFNLLIVVRNSVFHPQDPEERGLWVYLGRGLSCPLKPCQTVSECLPVVATKVHTRLVLTGPESGLALTACWDRVWGHLELHPCPLDYLDKAHHLGEWACNWGRKWLVSMREIELVFTKNKNRKINEETEKDWRR